MRWFLTVSILLLAVSSKALDQCEYIYVAEPPGDQLTCDPFVINQLQLDCSIFVEIFSRTDTLRFQWFYSQPINLLYKPANNMILLTEASFNVTGKEAFTSRIVVIDPPIGFYFCQPLLDSGRQLRQSNIATLQPPSFYQRNDFRQCQTSDYHDIGTRPSCAELGIVLAEDKIIAPAPTVTDSLQSVSPAVLAEVIAPTLSMPLQIQETPTCNRRNKDPKLENFAQNPGFIAVVVIGSTFTVVIALSCFVLIVLLAINRNTRKRSYNTVRVHSVNDGSGYSITPAIEQSEDISEESQSRYTPPAKPPPKLRRSVTGSVSQHYNRLNFPKVGQNKSHPRTDSNSSTYYTTPEHDNNNGVQYYIDINGGTTRYIDGSESYVCTDTQYSTESDLHLRQQQSKENVLVRSSSLDLQQHGDGDVEHSYQNLKSWVKRKPGKRFIRTIQDLEDEEGLTIHNTELETGYVDADTLDESTTAQ